MRLPRRRWVVESRTNPLVIGGVTDPWARSLGPYFRKKTAESYLNLCVLFSNHTFTEWRVRNIEVQEPAS